jgi:hypothetical protein
VLDSFTVDAATVTSQYPQSSIPLQGARVATLNFTAISPTLPEIPGWLNSMRDLPGFVDATPGSVSLNDDGTYTANIVLHIDAQAYSNRLTVEDADSGSDADADTGTDDEGAEQ